MKDATAQRVQSQRKLQLVLDLDHTLIHATHEVVGMMHMKRPGNGCGVSLVVGRRSHARVYDDWALLFTRCALLRASRIVGNAQVLHQRAARPARVPPQGVCR